MFQSIVLLAKMGQKDKTRTFVLLKDITGWRSSDTLYGCQEREEVGDGVMGQNIYLQYIR